MKLLLLAILVFYLASESDAGCGCPRPSRNFRKRGIQVFGEDITDKSLEKRSEDDKVVEGDEIFTERDYAAYTGFRASVSETRRWPDKTLRFTFKGMSNRDRTAIRNALAKLTLSVRNCVKFQEYTSPPRSGGYVEVFSGGGCYSYVGHYGNKQPLSLSTRGCISERTVQHEFMHALGFYHEQSRPDRDRNIRVEWGNIMSGTCSNFHVCRGCKTTTPYDVNSIMHYWGTAFSCNGKPTLVNLRNERSSIQRATVMTENDKKKIMDYYC